MSDLIIRVPYTFRDERLFPEGWRSFSQLIYSPNNIELTKEYIAINHIADTVNEYYCINSLTEEDPNTEITCINDIDNVLIEIICKVQLEISSETLSVNSIEEPKTTEIICVNDIISVLEDLISVNTLEISNEIIEINSLNETYSHEIIGINYLSAEKTSEIISYNDILSVPIISNEIIGINRIDPPISFETYSPDVSIYIDGAEVISVIDSWEIKIDENSYVHTAKVNFADKSFFSSCDPALKIGEKRIRIVIDEITFNFMLEKRDLDRSPSEAAFSVWGRSYIAILSSPYSIPIIDKEVLIDYDTGDYYSPDDSSYVPHIWQMRDCMASEIMEYVIGDSFDLVLEIDDFIVKQNSITFSGETPIGVVDKIASVVGGKVRTDLNDRVIVKPWKFDVEGSEMATFTEAEDIFMLNEQLSYPEGYNKVLVKGYESPTEESSTNLNLELDEELNEGETTFSFGEEIWIRLYKSPFSITYDISCSLGSLSLVSSDTMESITRESSGFAGTTLNTDYPIVSITSIEKYDCTNLSSSEYSFTEGYSVVTSDSSIQDEPVLISYASKYDLYKLVINQPCDPVPWSEVLSQITAKQN